MNGLNMLGTLAALAPMTVDTGMSGAVVPVIIGAVLVVVFVALTIIQKKRKQNKKDDD